MWPDRVTLLSVRPRFAEALLEGTKTVEIRRRRVRIAEGSLCLLYASSPACALVGAIRVRGTDTDTPESLWRRWGDEAGLTRPEYDLYLSGSTLPCAIVVADAVRLREPIELGELRRRQDDFVTPQSYRFLRTGELASLTNGQTRQLEGLASPGVQICLGSSSRLTRAPSGAMPTASLIDTPSLYGPEVSA